MSWANGSTPLSEHREWQYILHNGPTNLTFGYRETMNGLVLRAMDSVTRVNNLSVALLVAEGCCMCLMAIAYMWLLLQRVAAQRYSLFAVFLAIPSALLRALASKKVSVSCRRGEAAGRCLRSTLNCRDEEVWIVISAKWIVIVVCPPAYCPRLLK